MRKLLNTLYITSDDVYLRLDADNIVAYRNKIEVGRYPLHIFSSIVSFSYLGASPDLMGSCASRGISLVFCSPHGKFLARSVGENNGNVLLRREQYRIADDEPRRLKIVQNFIFGKIYNSRSRLERMIRDHGLILDVDAIKGLSQELKNVLLQIKNTDSIDSLRGLEGYAANIYFSALPYLILSKDETFYFKGRNRRPPLDPVNSLLSFAYSLLHAEMCSALESVGLDSYVGFMHTDRPGRTSLALDLMEELRPCIADRFVFYIINNKILKKDDFVIQQSGNVSLTDGARRLFLKLWQEKKKETLTHPYLKEIIPWGLVPYVQALLLSRVIRGDMDEYPPFCWK